MSFILNIDNKKYKKIEIQNLCQNTEAVSYACWTTFSNNNLKQSCSV